MSSFAVPFSQYLLSVFLAPNFENLNSVEQNFVIVVSFTVCMQSMQDFVNRQLIVHNDHVHRTMCADERQPRSSEMNSSIRTISSDRWYLTAAGPIYRWSMPWRRSEQGNRAQVAEVRQPSIWTATRVAATVSWSSSFHELIFNYFFFHIKIQKKKNIEILRICRMDHKLIK